MNYLIRRVNQNEQKILDDFVDVYEISPCLDDEYDDFFNIWMEREINIVR